MMNKFTEAKLEKAFIELLVITPATIYRQFNNEGYPHHLGYTISRNAEDVLIEEDLKSFLLTQYKKDGLTVTEADSIVLQLN